VFFFIILYQWFCCGLEYCNPLIVTVYCNPSITVINFYADSHTKPLIGRAVVQHIHFLPNNILHTGTVYAIREQHQSHKYIWLTWKNVTGWALEVNLEKLNDWWDLSWIWLAAAAFKENHLTSWKTYPKLQQWHVVNKW